MTKIQELIKLLSFNLLPVKRWRLAPLSAVQYNKIFRSSTYDLPKRFNDLKSFLIQIYDHIVRALMPTTEEKIDVHRILRKL